MRTFTIVPSFEGNSAFFELPDIGFQGDNLSFAILFNLTELTEHWPDILPTMIITDPKNNTFLATHTRWDAIRHIFTWFISETETQYDGVLKCQLKCVSSSDPETVVCMSQICQTRVYKSLEAASDPPEAFQSWLDALERLAAEVHADLEYTLENVENIDEMISGVSDDIEVITNGINGKLDKPSNVGTLDQVLYNNGDGTTRWDDPITEEDVKDAVGEWMDENIPSGTAIALDPTLSILNTAAEASVTGNRLSGLQKNVEDYKVNPDLLVSYKQAVPGNVVEVHDAVPEAVKQMQIAIEPVQDLNGYTKPWAPGGGKNLCPVDTVDFQASTTWVNLSNQNASTVTNGTKVHLAAGTYNVGFTDASNINTFQMFDSAGNYLLNGTAGAITISSEQDTYIRFKASDTSVNTKFKIQVEAGSTKTEWEPYANVCPISGFTGCEVLRSGKNLVGCGTQLNGYATTAGGGKFVTSGSSIGYYFRTKDLPDTIAFNATNGNRAYISYYNTIPANNVSWAEIDQTQQTLPKTIIVNKGYPYIHIQFSYNQAASDVQVESGNNATDYEAPNRNVYTTTFPSSQTVYGGTLTINRDGTGTLVVNRATADLGSFNYTYTSSNNRSLFYTVIDDIKPHYSEREPINVICSEYTPIAYLDTWVNGIISYGRKIDGNKKEIVLVNNAYSNAANFKTAMSGSQIVYELAAPTSIQLAVPQVQTLLGYNRLYANTGDILSLEYPVERHQLADQAEKERVHKVLDAEYGAVVSEFDDGADNAPMAMKIKFEPKQDLNGYDRPWSGGAGKNLCPMLKAEGTNHEVTSKNNDNGSFSFTGTASSSGGRTSDYMKTPSFVLPAGTYIVSLVTESSSPIQPIVQNDAGTSTYCTQLNTPFTLNEATTVSVGFNHAQNVTYDGKPQYVQLESGSTVTDWEPYSNICPIDGLSGVDVTRTGNNLFGDYITSKKTITAEGVISNYDIRSATVNGMRVKPNTTYTLSYTSSGIRNGVFYYKNNGSFLFYLAWENEPRTFTTPEDCELVKFAFDSGTVPTNVKLEEGSTVTSYEPYFGQTYPVTFPSEVGTVYGGTLTVNKDGTGSLVVDKASYTIDGTETGYQGSTSLVSYGRGLIYTSLEGMKQATDAVVKSNKARCVTKHAESDTGLCVSGRTGVSGYALALELEMIGLTTSAANNDILTAFVAWLVQNNVQIIYELATPITYNLSAPVIRSLIGKNRVWSNDGEITHLEYSKDIETVFNDYADSINAISIHETVDDCEEANVFSIPDGVNGAPIVLTVGIEPVQDKHGLEPYPPGGGINLFETEIPSSVTVSDITFTLQSDGSLIANGTNTSGSTQYLYLRTQTAFGLNAGTYTKVFSISGTASGITWQNREGTASGAEIFYATQNVIAKTLSTDIPAITSRLAVAAGASATNARIYLMICSGDVTENVPEYAPYSNICPITEWTGAEVTRTGKNLFNGAELGSINQTTGQNAYSDSAYRTINHIRVNPGNPYTISGLLTATGLIRIFYYDAKKNYLTNEVLTASNGIITKTVGSNVYYIRFQANNAVFTDTTPIQCEVGTNASIYEAYQGETYSITFPTTAGTVYSGTLTVNKDGTGCLTIDKATVTFDGSSDETINNGNASGLLRMLMKLPNGALLTGNGMSDKLSWKATADEAMVANTVHWYEYPASSSVPGVFADCRFSVGTYDNTSDSTRRAYLAQNPIQFVYELSEKITYNISVPVVKSLLGTNNIWADTGKILSVDYTRDTTMAVNSKVDTAYYEWQMQQTWDNIDTKAIPMSSIAYDIIHDYEKRRSL